MTTRNGLSPRVNIVIPDSVSTLALIPDDLAAFDAEEEDDDASDVRVRSDSTTSDKLLTKKWQAV